MATDPESWFSFTSTRVSRRTVLRGGLLGGAGLAAAALIGCGDDDDDDDDDDDAAATPTATGTATPTAAATETPAAGQPRRGGTFRLGTRGGPSTLDPLRTQDANTKTPAAMVYGTLFRQRVTDFAGVPASDFPGFMAKEWEFTPDGLTLTTTLQDAKFVAPGPDAKQPSMPLDRAVDSGDVQFSVNRFLGREGQEPAPNAAQLGFIESVDTPDAKTAVLNLNQTFSRVFWRLADIFNLLIMPKETGEAFDPTETMIGSGPFRWNGWQPDVNHKLIRNDSWWGGPDRPYFDEVEWSVLDNATQLVQFKAGNLDTLGTIGADQIPSLIEDTPDARVFPRKTLGWGYISRGEPRGVDAPHDDPRVRKAISMALDRDAMIEAVYNVSGLEPLGFPISELVSWHNIQPAGYAGQSVDPRTDPTTGAVIKFDLGEAKKLLDAAGRGDGFSVPYHYTTIYGSAWTLEAEIYPQLLREIGIDFQTEVDDFSSVYTPKTFRGDFEGVAFQLQAFPDLGDYLQEMYQPGAGRNHSKVDDPAILAKVTDINTTLDPDDRNEKIRSLNADLIVDMWYVPGVAWQLGWSGHSPRLGTPAEIYDNGRAGLGLAGYPNWWINQDA